MNTATDIVRQAASLAEDAANGVDVWESLATLGLSVTTYKGVCNYILGQAALTIEVRYGEKSLATWCEAVKINSVETAQQYRRIVECLGFERCITAAANNLKYDYIRRIVGAFKDHDDSAARDYLDKVLTLPIGAEYPPLPVTSAGMETIFKAGEMTLCDVNERAGTFVMRSPSGLGKLLYVAADDELEIVIRRRKKIVMKDDKQ